MPVRDRSFGQGCIAAHALDLIGDRWSLLVVRELMLGPRRFGGLRANLLGIATNMLADRLERLEAAGVIERVTLPAPADVPAYALTAAGLGLWPVVQALCNWGAAMPGHDPRLPMTPSSVMLSMKAQIRPGPARDGGDRTAAFILDDEGFLMSVRGGILHVVRDASPQAEIAFQGSPNGVAWAVYGSRPLAESVRQGLVRTTGDIDRAQSFVDLFSLDPPGERQS